MPKDTSMATVPTSSRARFVAGSAAVLASIAILTRPARAAQWTYRYASNLPIEHPLNVRMRECWDAVRAQTDGPSLNGALARTGALQLLFCLLFAAGILASGGISS